MGRVYGFLRISSGDKFRALLAAALLVAVRFSFVLVSFASCRRVLIGTTARLSPIVPGSPPPARVAWAVDATDRNLPGSRTCLMRSLTSEAIHRLYDHDVVHQIGVDPIGDERPDGLEPAGTPNGGFEAHSWIECEGEVILGDLGDLSRFEPLPPLNGTERS
ncbi:lasso peptide biosynthesis B2 protein [Natrarchaeobius oligotrophus]|uniref:Lasso peptide biosynthesis B2 protein n=1 Tax=Natrarchaeobius chitinivorans TaxID=1679083 RepID=A0A3N6MXT8_NATCH|nr:lasso peptide biosynthesis B2 protein [Natrarchaeobius chitinivorans]